jgi:hypothetical protein
VIRRRRNVALLVGIGLVAAAIVVFFVSGDGEDRAGDPGGSGVSTSGDDGSGSGSSAAATDGPEEADLDRLSALADAVGHPVYWAGERPGDYELTVSPDGSIFIRYLPEGVPVGSREVTSLTVATYPYTDAFATLRAAAKQLGAIRDRTPDGGIVVGNKGTPNTAYVAYPDADYQIEVYDPEAGRAFELATSGEIETVD